MTRLRDDGELVRRAVGYIDEFHRYAEAERIVRPVLADRPDDLNLIKLLGVAQFEQGHHDEALATFAAGLRLDPDDDFLHNRRAMALSKLDRDTDAIAAMARAVEISPHDYYHVTNYGYLLGRDGRHHEAIAVYRTALKDHPGDPKLLSLLGDCLYDVDEYVEAYDLLTAAVAAAPDDSDSRWCLGLVQIALSRARDSLTSLAEAARLAPDDAHRCAIVTYLMPWPITAGYGSLQLTLPLVGIGALVSALTGAPDWIQWIITVSVVAALGYSAHWLVRGGIAAWRALFRLSRTEIAMTGAGIGLGHGAFAAVLAGIWLPDPLLAAFGLTAAVLVWIVGAAERSFHPDTDRSIPVWRRIPTSLRQMVRDYRTVPRQLRDRHRLRRRRT